MSINVKNLLSSVAFIAFSASSTFASDFSNLEFRSQATTTTVNRAGGSTLVDLSKLEFGTKATPAKGKGGSTSVNSNAEVEKLRVRIFKDPLLGDRLMMETIGKGRSLYERINFYAAQNNLEKMSKIYNKAINLVKAKESVEAKQTAEESIDWFPSWSNRDDEESSSSDEADFMSSAMCPGSSNWDMFFKAAEGTSDDSEQILSTPKAQLNVDASSEEAEKSILPNVRNITEENLNQNLAEALTKYRKGMYGESSSGFNDQDVEDLNFEFSQANSALGTNGETDLEKYNRLKPISKYEMPQGFTQNVINIQNEIRSAKAFVKKYEIEQQLKANQRNDALKNVTTIENKDWVTREKERAAEAGFESSMDSSWE